MVSEQPGHVRRRQQRDVALGVDFRRRSGNPVVGDDIAPADNTPVRRSRRRAPDQTLIVALRQQVAYGFNGGGVNLAQKRFVPGRVVMVPERIHQKRRVVVDVQIIIGGLADANVVILDDFAAVFLIADIGQERLAHKLRTKVVAAVGEPCRITPDAVV